MTENPSILPREARTLGLLCHVTAFAGHIFPFGNIVGPLVVWLMKREEHPFVDEQGKESLNFQISITIYLGLSIVFAVVTCGFGAILTAAIGIFSTIMIILASIQAGEGKPFHYPLSIPFLS
ncbi:MAG: DUF4870 domain-containing protein [Acidobacteria bacterium]|nr:DUF4870 domain-containing protein [Acidobacteriota bacterium]